ncbi:MAG: transporter permease [Solirubrobacteraceae bacterium]|nr:transporter permease [Solirubrobacteraceae bacterium]
MSLWLQIVLSGLAAGSVYGLLAVGHTLVYRLTGMVHFALGDLVGLGVFAALLVTAGRNPVTQASASSWRFALGLIFGVVLVAAVSVAGYDGLMRRYLARGSTIGWVAASAAIAFAIQAVLRAVFVRPAYVFPDPFPFHRIGNSGVASVGGATFQVRALFVIALGLVLARGVTLLVDRTRFGRALQAISQDPEGARLVGVSVEDGVAKAFALVGAVAVRIAVVAAPSGPFSVPTGALLGLKGLVAALLVGFSAPVWAFVAGLALGVVESAIASGEIAGHGIGPAWREVIPIGLAVLLLSWRSRREAPELE